ncbi:hypothetical protein [Pseudomonas fluorescens]|uniref:hypothetical protein n=1 Tax=Pseudomonas fluorescens TaxID=294 RepID=UPI000A490B5A|nr:hypothetical protein [Pseudomonas fluorescens]
MWRLYTLLLIVGLSLGASIALHVISILYGAGVVTGLLLAALIWFRAARHRR